ncbi:hypothetical protein NE237_000679 [Protea cynaroides]|uniref:Uncharacterized protein n=1 Tax=Protea cynaroides TaxID=273540 RepID=A0A9Q0KRM3_9MAGN|nr:hypothetical protein NE237_000679 [Protea cynaroides]
MVEDLGGIYPYEKRTFMVNTSTLIIKWRAIGGVEICEGNNEVGDFEIPKWKFCVQRGAEGKLKVRFAVQTMLTIEGGESGEGWISWEPAKSCYNRVRVESSYSYTESQTHSTVPFAKNVNINIRFSFFERQKIITTVKDGAKTGAINGGNYSPISNSGDVSVGGEKDKEIERSIPAWRSGETEVKMIGEHQVISCNPDPYTQCVNIWKTSVFQMPGGKQIFTRNPDPDYTLINHNPDPDSTHSVNFWRRYELQMPGGKQIITRFPDPIYKNIPRSLLPNLPPEKVHVWRVE